MPALFSARGPRPCPSLVRSHGDVDEGVESLKTTCSDPRPPGSAATMAQRGALAWFAGVWRTTGTESSLGHTSTGSSLPRVPHEESCSLPSKKLIPATHQKMQSGERQQASPGAAVLRLGLAALQRSDSAEDLIQPDRSGLEVRPEATTSRNFSNTDPITPRVVAAYPATPRVVAAHPVTPRVAAASSPALPLGSAKANVGPREPMESLADEFRFNATFRELVRKLGLEGYIGWRRVRGDGNCFFRAVGFGLLEQLAIAREPLRTAWTAAFLDRLGEVQLEDVAEGNAHAELVSFIVDLHRCGAANEAQATVAMEHVFHSFRSSDSPLDLALIRALRRLVAQYLLQNAHNVEAGGGISFDMVCTSGSFTGVADFCAKEVIPLGVEAEGIVLIAAAAATGVHIRVAYLDRACNSTDLTFMDYKPDVGAVVQSGDRPSPVVHVQLRPGHYDLLCMRANNAPCASVWHTEDDAPNRSIAQQPCGHAIVADSACVRTLLPQRPFQTGQLQPSAPVFNKNPRKVRPPTFGGAEDDTVWAIASPVKPEPLRAHLNSSAPPPPPPHRLQQEHVVDPLTDCGRAAAAGCRRGRALACI